MFLLQVCPVKLLSLEGASKDKELLFDRKEPEAVQVKLVIMLNM